MSDGVFVRALCAVLEAPLVYQAFSPLLNAEYNCENNYSKWQFDLHLAWFLISYCPHSQDCSTQGLKASIVELGTLATRYTYAISYARDCQEYARGSGVHHDGAVATSPTLMVRSEYVFLI